MTTTQRHSRQNSLLQEGVSCALATLHAIEGSDLLTTLPADPDAAGRHNHGLAILHMLEDHLRSLQAQVDALDTISSGDVA